VEGYSDDIDHNLNRATIVAVSEVNEGSENGKELGQPFGSDPANLMSMRDVSY